MKIIDKVVDMVIEELENGNVPVWRKTWKDFSPMNAFSQRNYRGFNTLLLSFLCEKMKYPYPLFGTFKQISEAGGRVKRGETSVPIIYWKVNEEKKLNEKTGVETDVRHFTPFYYNVFNLAQTEKIDIEKYAVSPKDNNPLEMCEKVITNMPNRPRIEHNDQSRAYYRTRSDLVNIPEIIFFDGSAEYYAVMFHELSHSTGHSSRLNRFVETDIVFGGNSYDYEELVAEMAATMLCSHCGIEQTVDNSVAYLTGWAQFLKNERKTTLFGAATKAQAAVDYILGKQPECSENEVLTS
jgi:antirestriction protein ArdC